MGSAFAIGSVSTVIVTKALLGELAAAPLNIAITAVAIANALTTRGISGPPVSFVPRPGVIIGRSPRKS